MSKLLIFTDLHILAPPETIIGLDPRERLRQGLAHAARMHPDADHLLLMGDLTHHGRAEQFAELKEILADLPWPVSLMLGNHDRRANFRAAFPNAPVTDAGFVQSVVDLPDVRLITLDTLDEEPEVEHAGLLCEARLSWLEQQIDSAGDTPCLIFQHHPPFNTGFTGMDDIGLANAEEQLERIKGKGVVHIFAGHIHRTITATIGGQPMTVFKSTCHQMPMLLGQHGSGHSVDEPGAYGIVLTRDRDVVVHTEDFTLPAAENRDFDGA